MLPFSLKRLRALLRERGVGPAGDPQARLGAGAGAAAPRPAAVRPDRGLAVLTRVAGRADGRCVVPAGSRLACRVAKKAAGTPATVLLTAQKVAHTLHPYEVSPDAPNYGALVAEALGVDAGRRSSRRWSPRWTAR